MKTKTIKLIDEEPDCGKCPICGYRIKICYNGVAGHSSDCSNNHDFCFATNDFCSINWCQSCGSIWDGWDSYSSTSKHRIWKATVFVCKAWEKIKDDWDVKKKEIDKANTL